MSTAVVITASSQSGQVYARTFRLSTLFDDSDVVKGLKEQLRESELAYYRLSDQYGAVEAHNRRLLHEITILREHNAMTDAVAVRCVLGLVRR